MKFKVSVRQIDIDRGIRHHPHECPVANALDNTDGFAYPTVEVGYIRVAVHGVVQQFSTAPLVANFIDAFDDGLAVQPFEFELEIPEVTS